MILTLMKDRISALARGDFSTASFISIKISHLFDRDDALGDYNTPDDLQFINHAIVNYENYKRKIPAKQLALSGKNYEVVFDAIIPNSWNLNSDLIIIDSSLCHENEFEQFLKKVGQKRYIFVRSDIVSSNTITEINLDPKLVLEKIGLIIPNRIAFFLSHRDERDSVFEAEVTENIRRLRLERNTIRNFEDVWRENIIDSVPFYKNSYCASRLAQVFNGRAILVISPGPSLLRNAEALEKKRSEFIFVAVAQSVPSLTKMKITPDFVMVVDPKDYSAVLSGLDFKAVKGLIAFEAVHRNFFSAGFRNLFVISPPSSPIENYRLLQGKPIELTGGSVSVQACALCVAMGASLVGLVGQDLCLPDGVQYAHSNADSMGMGSGKITHNEFGELFFTYSNGLSRPVYSVSGRTGETLLAPEDYYMYRKQLEELALHCEENHNVKLFNFSEGGAQINGFQNDTLGNVKGSVGPLYDLPEIRDSDYVHRLLKFVDSCIKENENFSEIYGNVSIKEPAVIEQFLSIPSIRFFGQRDLVNFFSEFDGSMTSHGVEVNQKNLELLMNDLLYSHLRFFQKIKKQLLAVV